MTLKEAKDARDSCADVFTKEGDAGCIERIWLNKAFVTGRLVWGWFDILDLSL